MEERMLKRLEELRAIREQLNGRLAELRTALEQTAAQVNACNGAIAEIEALLKPEPQAPVEPPQG